MARSVKATKATTPVAKASPTRSAPAKRAPAATASAPKLGKEELRAQVEKLERANATLRAKNRQAGQDAKAAAARVAELEAQVQQLEQKAASQEAAAQKSRAQKAPAKAAPAKTEPAKPAKPASTRTKRQKPGIDPGDAVPPGVAVAEPLPLDEEAETAKKNLEDHLDGE